MLLVTARLLAREAVLAMGLCLCLSQVGVLLKRINVASHKQHHTIVQGHKLPQFVHLASILMGCVLVLASWVGLGP